MLVPKTQRVIRKSYTRFGSGKNFKELNEVWFRGQEDAILLGFKLDS